ncbi:hypothetical protein Csp2054_14345 [Curtobacterium sp. 'Ferrero']|uniref:hypothetical protein n=1 Tax=Curtobacterium sp. 'Ferrero' TaxID=2033654 RepID=UPI000BD815A9|nr:hypothetical protein [Curtobacterium sp. 'Ferrero']PCN47019.1 hypothetical protein Csp2054_14345 [Curtobacterium sp. 'Ferrero']
MTQNIIDGIQKVVRKATDISSKVQAVAVGGVTTVGVNQIIETVAPGWNPPAWALGLITVGVALVFGYIKKETINVSTTRADGTVIQNASVDMADVPEIEMPDWVKAQIDAQNAVGADEAEQAVGPDAAAASDASDDVPKHLAAS